MNLPALVTVVLRLLALDFLLRIVIQLTPQILLYARLYQGPSPDHSPSFLPWLVLLALFIGAVLLWCLAMPIARLVSRGLPSEISFGALSLVDCYTVVFMAVGLFYIASHLPQVLNWSYYLFKMRATNSGDDWKQQVQWYEVSRDFITFIVGIVLFVYGRKWAVLLARRRTEADPMPMQ